MTQPSFLVLSASTPWVYALAEALAQTHPTHAVRFYDWRNYVRLRPSWGSGAVPDHLRRSLHTLPPGYAGRLEWFFRPYLQHLVQQWCRQLQAQTGEPPWVIAPYPYLAPWVRNIRSQQLIYYNLDDYRLYEPDRQDWILKQEAQLVQQAAKVLCLAQFQVQALQKRYPDKAECIYHFPLGVSQSYLNPHPDQPPEPKTVGYIGNLSDRVDWQLVERVATACPGICFIFVGSTREPGQSRANWQVCRDAVLALPNVRHIPKIPQDQVPQYYRSFAVNWIPYALDHPFNLAACPTKIMDGLASGRPLLSSDLPECGLYPQWIAIFRSPAEAISQIHQFFDANSPSRSDRSPGQQIEFARQHTWESRARTLAHQLSSHSS